MRQRVVRVAQGAAALLLFALPLVSRLTEMIDKERHFSADTFHQLRTPLTGLELGLEAALANPPADLRPVLLTAARQVRELPRTVDDVLALARLDSNQWLVAIPLPLGQMMGEVENRWHGSLAAQGRRLQVNLEPDLSSIEVPASLVTQILNVLIDNAVRHGRGGVTLTAREVGEALAVDVGDEGSITTDPAVVFDRGTSGDDGPGIGLALARSLAEARGGRLLLTRRSPTTFTLFIRKQRP